MAKWLLEADTAAELAGVSVRHFRKLAEAAKLKVIKIGRHFFWLRAEVETLRRKRKAA